VARFVGGHTRDRVEFLREELWLAPLALFLFAVGVAQVAALLGSWFLRTHG